MRTDHSTVMSRALKGAAGFLVLSIVCADTPAVVAQEFRPSKTLNGHKGHVYTVAVSPDGKTVASGGADELVRVWGADSGKEQMTLKGHTNGVASVTFK